MRLRLSWLLSAAALVIFGQPATAQMLPESAHVNLYFPHLADGGGQNEYPWQTSLTFLNPGTATARVTTYFSDDSGSELKLDFGQGASSSLTLDVPPHGTRVVNSSMGAVARTGWAYAWSNLPVQGIVSFRRYENGKPTLEVADNATLPTISYSSYANSRLGIAVANIYDVDMPLIVTLYNREGAQVAQNRVTVSKSGHKSFNLYGPPFNVASGFEGSISIDATDSGPRFFIAWTLNVTDAGLVAALPSGRYSAPASQTDRIEKVFYTILDQFYYSYDAYMPSVNLNVTQDSRITAWIHGSGSYVVDISLGTAEILGQSDSDLAFILGHELAHALQAGYPGGRVIYTDYEQDADALAMLSAMGAGYDPYAAAGVYGTLRMASAQPGVVGSVLGNTEQTAYAASAVALDNVLTIMYDLCSGSSAASCAGYKSLVHPNAPGPLPLSIRQRGTARR